jgi:beta-lactamase superfamily II metal-dependent hydrolase
MAGELVIRIFDVEHGACAIMQAPNGRIAMIDCGHNSYTGWRPSVYIRHELQQDRIGYFLVTNADRDHLSDAAGLREHGVYVEALIRNGSPTAPALRILKEAEGPLPEGVKHFLEMHGSYHGNCVPFNDAMAGVTCATFCNTFPDFSDTNNLSMATFIKYAGVKFLFPGDLEKAGWRALLQHADFRAELANTDILVASHHGRESGFCEDSFKYFRPQVVVISDTGMKYETQEMVPDYRDVLLSPDGVPVTCGTELRRRHVLTTRADGDIIFRVTADGYFYTTTTKDKYSKKAA